MKILESVRIPPAGKLPYVFVGSGVAAALLVWFASGMNKGQASFSLLTSTYFWLSLSLGALFFTMLHHIVAAKWSVVIRRVAEGMSRGVMPLGLLAVGIMYFAMEHLYPWANAEAMANDHHLHKKIHYLNAPFFTGRAIFYILAWSTLSYLLWKFSTRDDESPSENNYVNMRKVSAIGLLVFGLTFTFSSFDWIMSLDPMWYSTIFGLYCFAGSVVAVMSALILTCLFLEKKGYLKDIITTEHFHDLGKLLFAFTCFWAYMAFSQYILIWYANIPEETIFYHHRWVGSWKPLSLVLAIGHFAVPFVLSMPKPMKRSRTWLAVWAIWMLVLHYIDLYWLVFPNFHHHGVHFSWTDIMAMASGGLIFIGSLMFFLTRANLIPKNDPKLEASLNFRNS